MQTGHLCIWERTRRVRAREERRKQRRVCRKVGSALQGRGRVCALTIMPTALRRRHYGDGERRARRQGSGESTTTARRASIERLLDEDGEPQRDPLRGSRGGWVSHGAKLILLGACAFAVGSGVLSTACQPSAAATIDRTRQQQPSSTR